MSISSLTAWEVHSFYKVRLISLQSSTHNIHQFSLYLSAYTFFIGSHIYRCTFNFLCSLLTRLTRTEKLILFFGNFWHTFWSRILRSESNIHIYIVIKYFCLEVTRSKKSLISSSLQSLEIRKMKDPLIQMNFVVLLVFMLKDAFIKNQNTCSNQCSQLTRK